MLQLHTTMLGPVYITNLKPWGSRLNFVWYKNSKSRSNDSARLILANFWLERCVPIFMRKIPRRIVVVLGRRKSRSNRKKSRSIHSNSALPISYFTKSLTKKLWFYRELALKKYIITRYIKIVSTKTTFEPFEGYFSDENEEPVERQYANFIPYDETCVLKTESEFGKLLINN